MSSNDVFQHINFWEEKELKDFRVFYVVDNFPKSGIFAAPYSLHVGEVLEKDKSGNYSCERKGPLGTKYKYSVPASVIENQMNSKYFKEVKVHIQKKLEININQN